MLRNCGRWLAFAASLTFLLPALAHAQQPINLARVNGAATSATNTIFVQLSDGSVALALAEDGVVGDPAPSGGPQMTCRFADFDGSALPTQADVEADSTACITSAVGVHYVMLTNEDGSLSPLVVEDVGETAANVLMGIGTVRRDTAASSAGSTGDNATANTDANGLLWTRSGDPCTSAATKQYINIDITTATTTELTASLAGAATYYYVCALNLVTDAANDVSLVDDDSDGCGSPTAGLSGGVTAAEGWNFAANGGMAFGNGAGTVLRAQTANSVLCLVTSATTQLSGQIVVVAAP